MIRDLRVYEVLVPMRRPFDHATHARSNAESVLVRVDLDGAVGWGEGAPRRYVTGESTTEAMAAFDRLDPARLDQLDWSSIEALAAALLAIDLPRVMGKESPAPSCGAALELAVLDAACRAAGKPLSVAVAAVGSAVPPGAAATGSGVPRLQPAGTPVSLVIDLSRSPAAVLDDLAPTSLDVVTHVKVKGPNDPAEVLRIVEEVTARISANTTVSVDANGAWPADVAVGLAPQLVELGVDWVEEPTTPRDWPTMRAIRDRGLGVMLDESFVDRDDIEAAVGAGAVSHLNIRISKCGGVLPAARYSLDAQHHGLAWQLGCHVGEVGPLWAAGRALAATIPGACAFEAGRQDEWFDPDLTEPPYQVDRDHWIAPHLTGPGTGLRPSDAVLTYTRSELRWQRDNGGTWTRHST